MDVIECLDKPVDGVMGKHKHIANLYNLALPKLETAVVLVVEDDSLPLPGAYARAAATLATYGNCGALSALYRTRTNPRSACTSIAVDHWGSAPEYAKVPRELLRVGFVGAGFTLYRLSAFRAGSPFHVSVIGGIVHGWDANLCLQMRRDCWDILLDGRERVGHHCREVLDWCARTKQPIA